MSANRYMLLGGEKAGDTKELKRIHTKARNLNSEIASLQNEYSDTFFKGIEKESSPEKIKKLSTLPALLLQKERECAGLQESMDRLSESLSDDLTENHSKLIGESNDYIADSQQKIPKIREVIRENLNTLHQETGQVAFNFLKGSFKEPPAKGELTHKP